jgi:hypothetical protein
MERQAVLESEHDGGILSRHRPIKESLARHVARIEREVLRIQARLRQIELDVRRPRAVQPRPWQAELGWWAYVALLAVVMAVAALLPWIWR